MIAENGKICSRKLKILGRRRGSYIDHSGNKGHHQRWWSHKAGATVTPWAFSFFRSDRPPPHPPPLTLTLTGSPPLFFSGERDVQPWGGGGRGVRVCSLLGVGRRRYSYYVRVIILAIWHERNNSNERRLRLRRSVLDALENAQDTRTSIIVRVSIYI